MRYDYNNIWQNDNGSKPFVTNIEKMAERNRNYRTTVWTGEYLQMTVMSIPVGDDIGLENHRDLDQFIRIEQGRAAVLMGKRKNIVDFEQNASTGDGIFIPADTWHNVINVGRNDLKLSVFYAPPNHPKGTIQRTKEKDRDKNKDR